MCIRDSVDGGGQSAASFYLVRQAATSSLSFNARRELRSLRRSSWRTWRAPTTDTDSSAPTITMGAPRARVPVSYTHLRAHETPEHLVCRLLLEKKKNNTQ